jgi:hypothetical protein
MKLLLADCLASHESGFSLNLAYSMQHRQPYLGELVLLVKGLIYSAYMYPSLA